MPADELVSVVIKQQHNCTSDRGRNNRPIGGVPRIGHEYLLIWRRPDRSVALVQTLKTMAHQANRRLRGTWRAVVRQALVALGGEASLSSLYSRIAEVAPERPQANAHWQAKVRQVVQTFPDFERVDRGRWRLA